MANKKNGIIEKTTAVDDLLALIYAIDQTHEIMTTLNGGK